MRKTVEKWLPPPPNPHGTLAGTQVKLTTRKHGRKDNQTRYYKREDARKAARAAVPDADNNAPMPLSSGALKAQRKQIACVARAKLKTEAYGADK